MAIKKNIARLAATAGLLLSISTTNWAQNAGTDIFLPSIELNGVRYNNVTLRIFSAEVRSIGATSTQSDLPTTCNPYTQLTHEKLDQIAVGMTLDQVNAVIGCHYTPPLTHIDQYCDSVGVAPGFCREEEYIWGSMPNIRVGISRATGGVVVKTAELPIP